LPEGGGHIKLTSVLQNNAELILDIQKAGDFSGENMFSEEGEYPVSAVCLEGTKILPVILQILNIKKKSIFCFGIVSNTD
jgi:hypothetical protein